MQTPILFTALNNPFNFNDFKELVINYAEKNKTTGEEALPERIEATKINAQRVKRIDKQIQLEKEIIEAVKKIQRDWTWIVLVESWCGDGAQNLPIIAKIAALSSNIQLKIILRDENPQVMEAYLTNGSRSIPKLICIDTESNEEIGTWGPRPSEIQRMVKEYKAKNPDVPHDEFVRNLHYWYAKDKGLSLQKDFVKLIQDWTRNFGK